jgi:hypothetical protein
LPSRKRHLALALVLVAGLAGCTSPPPEPSPSPSLAESFRRQIDRFLSGGNPSDLQREILADYWITDAEMREAEDLMRQCLEDAHPDLTVTFNPAGGYDVGPVDPFYEQYGEELGDQKFQEVVDTCANGTVGPIQHFYVEPRRNPEGLTYAQLVRRCFEARGITDGRDLSDAEFDELITGSGYTPSPEARDCMIDPYGS